MTIMDKEYLIQHYLLNKLSEEEQKQFDKLIAEDAEFKEEVEMQAILFATFKVDAKKKMLQWKKDLPTEKTAIESTSKPISKPILKPTETKVSRFPTFLKSMAALLVLGILSYGIYSYLVPTTYSVNSYLAEKHPSSITFRGDNPDKKDQWDLAIAAYDNGKYAIAVDEIKKIPSLTDEQNFYLGLSYLYQEDVDRRKAIEVFQDLLKEPNKFKDETEWFLSLAYLKNKEKAKAIPLLKNIVKMNAWNVEKAKRLLEEI